MRQLNKTIAIHKIVQVKHLYIFCHIDHCLSLIVKRQQDIHDIGRPNPFQLGFIHFIALLIIHLLSLKIFRAMCTVYLVGLE